MPIKRLFFAVVFLFAFSTLKAQFYTTGDDPGRLKWYHIQTSNYDLIYPEGLDSLAQIYAGRLEHFRPSVGRSAGYVPNGSYRNRLPVILHSWSALSNGAVTWAPRRMDLYTQPDPDSFVPDVWIDNLVIHESRHVAQMQYGNAGRFRAGSVLLGDLFAGALAAVYCGPSFFEGDAVVAETALSPGGRGRNADFLEYYRACLAEGYKGDWYRWIYGSQRYYTPTYYAAGYMLFAGERVFRNDPLFTERYYENIFSRKLPFPFFNLQKTLKDAGGKNIRESFEFVEDGFAEVWKENTAIRAPFMPQTKLTEEPEWYEDIKGAALLGETLYAVKTGIASTPQLVHFAGGKFESLRPMSSGASVLSADEFTGRLFWSERRPDPRWSLGGTSVIRYYEPATGRTGLLRGGAYMFNPSSSSDGRLAVSEYFPSGETAVTVLDSRTGGTLESFRAPDGLQVVESAWRGRQLLASGISEDGFGIYLASEGYRTLLEPSHVSIKNLRTDSRGNAFFLSDRTGVNELYSLSSDAGAIQWTDTENGINSFAQSVNADSLYYTVLTREGRILCRTALSDMKLKSVSMKNVWHNPVAETLKAQEEALTACDTVPSCESSEGAVGQPERYGKLQYFFRFHSWAPVYCEYDNIQSVSFDSIDDLGKLGATAFFQNNLGTAYGYMGYSASPYEGDRWKHAGHLDVTYTGLYPVLEAHLDLNQTDRMHYWYKADEKESGAATREESVVSKTGFSGYVRSYIPLIFNSCGVYRGIVPQIKYSFSNSLIGVELGKEDPSTVNGRLSASLRGYVMLPTASSGIYPKWGFGAEAGFSERPGLTSLFSPCAYAYFYAYVPAILPQHGIRLTSTLQARIGSAPLGELAASVTPRGLSSSVLSSQLAARYQRYARVTADYVMAVLPVDCSLFSPVFYLRNFELGFHCDNTFFGGAGSEGHLGSVGGKFVAHLGNLLWIPYDTRVGVSYSWNFGQSFEELKLSCPTMERNGVSFVFDVDF